VRYSDAEEYLRGIYSRSIYTVTVTKEAWISTLWLAHNTGAKERSRQIRWYDH